MSFSISSRSEILPERLFVEASAGTGKTYVIEHYIVRSILAAPVCPEKIALITFTKAVARELRQRLLATLQGTVDCVVGKEGENPPSDYLLPVMEMDDFAKGKVARSLENVIEKLDLAMITTIHGFCDRLLTAFEEEQGASCIEEWIGEEEKKEWIKEFLHEGACLRGFELEILSKRYAYEQDHLVNLLSTMMDDLHKAKTDDTSWEEAKAAVARVKAKIGDEWIAATLIAKAKTCRGNVMKDGTFRREVERACVAVQRILEAGLSEEELLSLVGCSFRDYFSTPLVKKKPLSEEEEARIHCFMEELWPALETLLDCQDILQRLSQRCAASFLEFVTRSGKKTPQTVVHRVLELSTDAAFVAWAAEKVDFLIVDEFQDTDAVQYAIFSRLFCENPRWHGYLLFVGDPKQAIYAFRKADVYSYLAARASLPPDQIRTLAVNYRAEPLVVAAQNRLFAGPEHQTIFYLPRTNTSLSVVPCESEKETSFAFNDGRGAFHFFVAHDHLGRKRRWPHDEIEEQLFSWLADEIITLEEKGILFRSQAILVKDRYQARRVQQFLNAHNIPTCAWRVDSVTDSPMYSWLLKAISLAERPQDQRRLSSLLLFIPSEGRLELCRAMASDKRLDQWAACATAWNNVKEAFYEGGIASMARALFSCRWDGLETVEEWLRSQPHGEELLIDVEHLLELLSLLDPILPHSLEAYSEALRNITSHFSEEPESLIRRVDPDSEGVPILTMHRSKGLEFDVVYALGVASRTPQEDDILVEEVDTEKLRQLYVAVTRAKRRCYVPLLIDEDERPIPTGTASPVELLCAAFLSTTDPSLSWVSTLYQKMSGASHLSLVTRLSHENESVISISEVSSERRQLSCAKKKNLQTSSARASQLSYSTRRYRSFSSLEVSSQGPSLPIGEKGAWVSSSMPCTDMKGTSPSPLRELALEIGTTPHPVIFGIRFHEAIARLLFAPLEIRSSFEAICEWLRREGKSDDDMAQILYDALRVELPIGNERVCLQDIPRADMRAECAFLDKDDGDHYVRGVLDLVFVWKGAVYVVDWKTHEIKEGSCQEVVEKGYELQHQMYLEAVVRATAPDFRYGGFFFVFVRHLHEGGIVAKDGGALCSATP